MPKIILNYQNQTSKKIPKRLFQWQNQKVLHDWPHDAIVEIGVIICEEQFSKTLNYKYRKHNHATDVLSFPIIPLKKGHLSQKQYPADKQIILGDIIICEPIAARQAQEYHHPVNQEISTLFDHGLKHLLGFHHKA